MGVKRGQNYQGHISKPTCTKHFQGAQINRIHAQQQLIQSKIYFKKTHNLSTQVAGLQKSCVRMLLP